MSEKKVPGCLQNLAGKLILAGIIYSLDQMLLDGHITAIVVSFFVDEIGGLFGIGQYAR